MTKKAQNGTKATKDSTKYFKDEQELRSDLAITQSKFGLKKSAEENMKKATQAFKDESRQKLKGKIGFDANGYPKKKMGGMIKRADGSTSQRGLWDNIRANKGSGKKPTAAMLKQEKKIKAKKAQNGDEVKTVDRGELEEVTVTAKRTPTKSKMPSTAPSKSMNLSDKIKSVASSDNKKTGRLQAFKNDMKSSLSGLPKALRPVGATVAAGVNAIGGQIGFKKRTEAQKRAGELNRDSKKMGGKVAKKVAPKMMMMKKISKKK